MKQETTKNKYEQVDFFSQIAMGGGKRLDLRIPKLPEVPPLKIEHKELPKAKKKEISIPKFDEQKEYEKFLAEKKRLRKYYQPFLENHAKKSATPIKKERLVDFAYRKETQDDMQDFSRVLTGKGEWEQIQLPHYVGPTGVWNAFYKTTLTLEKKSLDLEYVLDFEAVDYIAEVYLNGRLVAHHTGFFAPFSAYLTPYIHEGDNTLVVVVKNDITTKGSVIDGVMHYGNKIYAETHLGYDEPELGWHHCPAGAGIYGKVEFVVCKKQRITDIYVRPDIDNQKITVVSTLYNYLLTHTECKVYYTLEGRNFKETVFEKRQGKIKRVLIEENYLEETFALSNFRLWTPNTPYLYQITVTITDNEGNIIDEAQTHFGMRKFHIDESSTPKGKFYFNNERIIMRGANEMGHLARCVMQNDYEQLIDDILIAKVAGLNFYRYTQRPALDDIYTHFDMLGMFCQTDFPTFLFIRESVAGEALRQVDEMERLTRNHPCVFIESFCNETVDSEDFGWEQHGFGRMRMQTFFDAARQTVLMCNPDRVVKYCDGDYAPPAEEYGLNDFHLYTYWYTSHGVAAGKFNKGYLPGFRKEWMAGCGEYGTDGLDRLELMRKYYPQEWLPKTDDEPWAPNRIPMGQCYRIHDGFFPEQENIKDWIKASQEWQRKALALYVHGLRRRVDYVQSTAVHLLIDAWPAGWTKTLVGVDRVPKPAYYSFKEANIPVRISIRKDKHIVYDDDTVVTEFFALNDTLQGKQANVSASVYYGDELKESYALQTMAEPISSTYIGDVSVCAKGYIGTVKIVAKMEVDGETTYDEVSFETAPRNQKASQTPIIYGEKLMDVYNVCGGECNENIVFCDNVEYRNRQDELEEKVLNGARVVIFTDRPIRIFDKDIIFRIHHIEEEVGTTRRMLWHNEKHPFVEEFSQGSFRDVYNEDTDYQDLISWFAFDWEGSEEILYSLTAGRQDRESLHKKHKLIMAKKHYGKGEIVLSTLSALKGCIGRNPYLDKLFVNLIEK